MKDKPYAMVFFDVDSTLVSIEGIDWLAGDNPEIAALTEAAMNGTITIDEVYGKRLEIIRPSTAAIEELSRAYISSLVEDAARVVATLVEGGVDVHLVTAGIEQALLPLVEHLGLPRRALHAVRLKFDAEGNYLDYDRRSLLARPGGKGVVVRDLRARGHGRAAFVGDGVTDLDAKPFVDLFIGFGGVKVRDKVRDAASVYITAPRLGPLLDHLSGGAQ